MVEVNIHPKWMKLPQHIDKVSSNALWQKDRHPAPDTDNLQMRDSTQPAQEIFQNSLWDGQWVATGKKHITNLGILRNVLNLAIKVAPAKLYRRIAHNSAARAIATIAGTLRCHQHQHAVGITMDESRHRRMGFLIQ